MTKGGSVILRIYFSLVSFVTLMILVFSVADLINLSLKTFVFPQADAPSYTVYCDPAYQTTQQCETQRANEAKQALVQKQQSATRDLSLLIIAAPLFWMHFRIVYRDWMEERNKS